MGGRRWPRRGPVVRRGALRSAGRALLLLSAGLIAAAAAIGSLIFRDLVTELAASAAGDAVTAAVNAIVKDVMTDGAFGADSLVTLERDEAGDVTAVTANVAAINTLAAEVLTRAEERTSQDVITVSVPLGSLTGSVLFAGRGPDIKVDVLMLSSSSSGFRSELSAAGINQTRHQLYLDLTVAISLLLPWQTVSTSVDTEILVSETVIVGDVPESYVNWENE
ncbi:MAG: sporulation protein YunB [Oscillospiraceae bacterium]|nr:sporulation protein YunB [Oscillospiraceae bacterium]